MELPVLVNLLIAGAVGLVIGIERGWAARERAEGSRAAGTRTFTIAGVTGGLAAIAGGDSLLLPAAVVAGATALVLVPYARAPRGEQDMGLTTEFALIATVLLGVAAPDYPIEALATAAAIATLLGYKQEIHRGIAFLQRQELLAALQLLVIAALIMPLLPDEPVGPWGSILPRTIGWLVLLIMAISFVGYFASRLLGERGGLLLAAFLGGLTSSTAVTVTYARLARSARQPTPLLAAGIALACATMAPRLFIEIGLVQAMLLARLWPVLLALGAVPLAYALWQARAAARRNPTELDMRNPLALDAAVVLAAGLTLLSLAVAAGERWLGDPGIYSVAALSGLLDVDLITVELSRRAGHDMQADVAARAIALAAISNTLVKAALVRLVGGPHLGRAVAAPLIAAAGLAGALSFWL